ncbi:MAG: RNB domain-containing ribonuclease, partial [Patescibacteria group bacterium]|nr:RNB domain-containing ribonuclease [Patescibacteria group bacterium]
STSVYYNTHALFMLPEDITVNKLSLNNNTTRLTLTVTINLDLDFNVVDSFIEETIFHNKKRFCYNTFSKSYYNPEDEYNETLSIIHKIAAGLYSNRYNRIIIDDFKDDDRKLLLDMHKDDIVDGKKVIVNDSQELQLIDVEYDQKKIPSFCIQELMILANKEVSNFCIKNKLPVTFRNHMPNWINKDTKPRNMDRAYYSEKMSGHYALGEESYCHFTSPIRRYADLVLHRQIKEFLKTGKKFYTLTNMRSLCQYINKKVHSIIDLQITEEREIISKQNERMLSKLSNNIKSVDISKLDFNSYEKLLKKFLYTKTKIIKLPEEILDITHEYLISKKNFSDDTIILMFFTKNNLDLDYLFGYIDTKHSTYLVNLFSKYFNRKKFSYKFKHFTTRTSYNSNNFTHKDNGGDFLKTSKQNKRIRSTYQKPNRHQIRLELYYNYVVVLRTSATSSDEKGAEIRAYSKFFKRIVHYYRKSKYGAISTLLKA